MSLSHKRTYLAGPALFAVIAATALTLGQAAPAGASPTSASARPRVSFKFVNNRIRSSQRPVIKYTSAHLPAGTRLELQRQFGTAHVWKNVIALKGTSGKATAPRVQMGRYRYRIRAYRSRKTVVFSPNGILYSYSRVPLSNICNDQENTSSVSMNGTDCSTSTVQVGNSVFVYLIRDFPPGPPNYDQDITFGANTSCRTISLQFSLDNNASNGSDRASIKLVQTASDAQSASVGTGQIASAYFKLDGGPWDLDLADSNVDGEYVNGYASCWTPGGLR